MDINDLEEIDEIYYDKSSKEPFSGKVTGQETGNLVNGKKEGFWVERSKIEDEMFEIFEKIGSTYYYTEHMNYKDGKLNGLYESYSDFPSNEE